MNQLQVFNFESNDVRVIDINNEPWFVASDVCKVLELSNPSMAVGRLENDERSKFNLGRQGETNIVNESGLYELIFASRKRSAKQFKKWVKQEVLPSIRKHGAYLTPDTLEQAIANPDFTIGLLTNLKEEQEKRRLAEHQAWQANLVLEQQRPKVVYAEAVEVSTNSILVKDLAALLKQKGIDIGQNRLFEWFRENDYLCKKEGSMFNKPTQKSMNLGLFELKQGVRTGSNGELKTTYTPKVTGKGQVYFINKLLNEKLKAEVN